VPRDPQKVSINESWRVRA